MTPIKMELKKYKSIIELLNKEFLKNKYSELPTYKKILIAQMIDKIEIIINS